MQDFGEAVGVSLIPTYFGAGDSGALAPMRKYGNVAAKEAAYVAGAPAESPLVLAEAGARSEQSSYSLTNERARTGFEIKNC